ncbi:hypothetical protein AB4Z10_20530 [Bosea sp. RAF48]|uniref:hypothetical protein n=1 Tax=Bosea sp. RAF48 TaxID=3237480 RepID=UPI003F8FDD9B
MKRRQLRALSIDRQIARTIARRSSPRVEYLAKGLVRVADERLLLPIGSVYWLAACADAEPRRNDATHPLLTMAPKFRALIVFPSGQSDA